MIKVALIYRAVKYSRYEVCRQLGSGRLSTQAIPLPAGPHPSTSIYSTMTFDPP